MLFHRHNLVPPSPLPSSRTFHLTRRDPAPVSSRSVTPIPQPPATPALLSVPGFTCSAHPCTRNPTRCGLGDWHFLLSKMFLRATHAALYDSISSFPMVSKTPPSRRTCMGAPAFLSLRQIPSCGIAGSGVTQCSAYRRTSRQSHFTPPPAV